ncbi:hypothetical protein pdam_00010832 [Pocillopora damicornis]|uniref:Uncharacterized protein n=1 Tax=Pocillopora damicornis TaxID=46731 RepID=A0A3M6TQG9_POCDA|nr:hypothetical protein pdam_00010832 [Pocillopora damicornis]
MTSNSVARFAVKPALQVVFKATIVKMEDVYFSFAQLGSRHTTRSSRYEACGKFGEHKRCIMQRCVQTSQVLHILMNTQMTYEPIETAGTVEGLVQDQKLTATIHQLHQVEHYAAPLLKKRTRTTLTKLAFDLAEYLLASAELGLLLLAELGLFADKFSADPEAITPLSNFLLFKDIAFSLAQLNKFNISVNQTFKRGSSSSTSIVTLLPKMSHIN